jgi:hypothetical protein
VVAAKAVLKEMILAVSMRMVPMRKVSLRTQLFKKTMTRIQTEGVLHLKKRKRKRISEFKKIRVLYLQQELRRT